MKNKLMLCTILMVLFLFSCVSMVTKPEIYDVNRVAIISVYSNSIIKSTKGESGLISQIAGMTSEDDMTSGTYRLTQYGYEEFKEQLETKLLWNVLSLEDVIESGAFSEFLESDFIKNNMFREAQDITMTALEGGEKVYHPYYYNYKDAFARLCGDLDVDAVITLEFFYEYRPFLSVGIAGVGGGFGGVKPIAYVKITAADRSGELVINSPRRYFEANTLMPLVAEELAFTEETERIYKKTTLYAINNMIKDLAAELK